MSTGEVANYLGAEGLTEWVERNGQTFIKIYNDTGAALNEGEVVVLDYGADADSLDPTAFFTVGTPATVAVGAVFGVVNNGMKGKTTIADGEWGWIQTRGYCPKVKTSETNVAKGRFLQAANGVKTAADDGTSKTADSFGVAISALFSTSYVKAILFGREATIG